MSQTGCCHHLRCLCPAGDKWRGSTATRDAPSAPLAAARSPVRRKHATEFCFFHHLSRLLRSVSHRYLEFNHAEIDCGLCRTLSAALREVPSSVSFVPRSPPPWSPYPCPGHSDPETNVNLLPASAQSSAGLVWLAFPLLPWSAAVR